MSFATATRNPNNPRTPPPRAESCSIELVPKCFFKDTLRAFSLRMVNAINVKF